MKIPYIYRKAMRSASLFVFILQIDYINFMKNYKIIKNENNLNPLMIYANRMLDVMNYRGISCKELAEKVYVAPSTISCYRKGRRNPSISELVNIANELDVSLDYLTGRTDNFIDFSSIAE